jgi:hypothetical protein
LPATDKNPDASTQCLFKASTSILISAHMRAPALLSSWCYTGEEGLRQHYKGVTEGEFRTDGGPGVWPLLRPSHRPTKPADFRMQEKYKTESKPIASGF